MVVTAPEKYFDSNNDGFVYNPLCACTFLLILKKLKTKKANYKSSFLPKQKTGRWNAMHVRIAWEIYYHQAKLNPEKTATPSLGVKASVTDMLRPPSHMFPQSAAAAAAASLSRPHELPPAGYPVGIPGRTPFDTAPLPASFLAGPTSHLGKKNPFF